MAKRTRVAKSVSIAEPQTIEQPVQEVKKEDSRFQGYETPDGEFDWDAYESDCPTVWRKGNPHVKTQGRDVVFCREDYAQDFYNQISNFHVNETFVPAIQIGEVLDGTVWGYNGDWCSVDVNYRELVYVRIDKEPEDFRDVKPGQKVSVLITDVPEDTNSHIAGSISGGIKQKTFIDIRESIESGNSAYIGTVTNMISNGGYIVDIQGVECFMPGSLAGINKLHDFNSIIGEEIYVVPVSFSSERGTIVVSHRKYLQALIPREIEAIKEKRGEKISGTVTGTAKYGVFCEFNTCLTGMIHINDLNGDTLAQHKNREIKPGDSIDFWVKDIISNTKITLTQRFEDTVDPWDSIEERYTIPSNVTAKIKTVKDYGLFIELEAGIVGLLHVSEIGEELIKSFSNGDDITVQVNRIDAESKKVYLKMPE